MPQFVRSSYVHGVQQTFGLDDGPFRCLRCNIQLFSLLDWVEHCDSVSHRTAEVLFGPLGYLSYRACKRIHTQWMSARRRVDPRADRSHFLRQLLLDRPGQITYRALSTFRSPAVLALDCIPEESLDRLGELESDTPYKCLCCDAWLFGLSQLRHHTRHHKHLRIARCVHTFEHLLAVEGLCLVAHLSLRRCPGFAGHNGCHVRRLIMAFAFDYRALCHTAARLFRRDLRLGLWRRFALRLEALDLSPVWWRHLSQPSRS